MRRNCDRPEFEHATNGTFQTRAFRQSLCSIDDTRGHFVQVRSADQYRDRAEELRTAAEGMNDIQARESLLNLARQYEEMAEKANKHAREFFKPPV